MFNKTHRLLKTALLTVFVFLVNGCARQMSQLQQRAVQSPHTSVQITSPAPDTAIE